MKAPGLENQEGGGKHPRKPAFRQALEGKGVPPTSSPSKRKGTVEGNPPLQSRIEEFRQIIEAGQALNQASNPLKAELNTARHGSFIFAPSHTKRLNEWREKSWEDKSSIEGVTLECWLKVGASTTGETLTVFDRRVFFASERLYWQVSPNPRSLVEVSLREIAATMRATWSSELIKRIKESLLRLRQVPILSQNALVDQETGEFVRTTKPKTILDDLEIYERGTTIPKTGERQVKKSAVRFRFDPVLESNLLLGAVKPILYNVITQIRGEIAFSLYCHLDVVLYSRKSLEDPFQRTLEGLFADLSITGKYSRPADKKRLIERAIKEIQGKPISSGILKKLKVVRTSDRKGYKLLAHKEPFPKPPPKFQPNDRDKDLIQEVVGELRDPDFEAFHWGVLKEFGHDRTRGFLSESRQITPKPGKSQKHVYMYLVKEARGFKAQRASQKS